MKDYNDNPKSQYLYLKYYFLSDQENYITLRVKRVWKFNVISTIRRLWSDIEISKAQLRGHFWPWSQWKIIMNIQSHQTFIILNIF